MLRNRLATGAAQGAATTETSDAIHTVGGVPWVLIGGFVLAVAALSLVVGAAPSGQAYLQGLADHATASTLAFTLFAAAGEGLLAGFYAVAPVLSALLLPSLVTFGLWAILVGTNLLRRSKKILQRPATMAPTS